MALNVYLGIWNEGKLRRIKVDVADLESNVEVLKSPLEKELGEKATDTHELTFCGLLLEDKKPLSSYGVTAGVTIHVTEKPKINEPSKQADIKFTEVTIQEFVSNYRSFKGSPLFRSTLHRLEDSAELDKVIAAVPGLQSDPIAIAFISKPEIFTQLEDPKTCWQIAEKNPLILAGAQYIITEFHKTTTNTRAALHPPPTSGHCYTLEGLSDDDEEMEGAGGQGSGLITSAQLAAAIASAGHGPSGVTATITPDMLQQALSPGRYASQLRHMRELGLADEVRNLRALTATAGDLQGAIDLVFSGALDDL
ncbi:unnamed protein product [Ceutorhynchus assimilis]|uniref:Ubiquitin-like domain-containing protein n=1 Tax=Ceutorhynchus assimilis TaxID=467358 RepID=A0A9N9MBU3_9CUCU|nr:unnamed protein product [Ceutorhynchus assimilis]